MPTNCWFFGRFHRLTSKKSNLDVLFAFLVENRVFYVDHGHNTKNAEDTSPRSLQQKLPFSAGQLISDSTPCEGNQNCNFPSFRIPQTERIDIDVSNFPIGPLEQKLGQDLLGYEKSSKTPSDEYSSFSSQPSPRLQLQAGAGSNSWEQEEEDEQKSAERQQEEIITRSTTHPPIRQQAPCPTPFRDAHREEEEEDVLKNSSSMLNCTTHIALVPLVGLLWIGGVVAVGGRLIVGLLVGGRGSSNAE